MVRPNRPIQRILNRRVHRACALFATGLIACSLGGCISTYFVPIEPGAPFELAENEALLVMQIDTDLPIKRLELSGLSISHPVEAGQHFWVAKVRPGGHFWSAVLIGGKTQHAARYLVRRSQYSRPGELQFRLEPGAINYVGELIVRNAGVRGRFTWISVRVRNHAAMAIRALEHGYSSLLDRYPLRTASQSDDAFLEFYASERARLARNEDERPDERLPK